MRIAALAFAALMGLTAEALAVPPPKVTNAVDGIITAFQTHPVVAIGEWHGLAQEMDLYAALIRDPRFAGEVGNVVLETGSETHQGVAVRYVNGETVPYAELRKVWSDVVGWVPTVPGIGSINVYATIRAVNQTVPPDQRIKVWLGEPPIDWTQIQTKADWIPLNKQRETHAADLIDREILSKGKKTLVIYGIGHLSLYPGYDNLRVLLEAKHPRALFIVAPYVGFIEQSCTARFEKSAKDWPVPALATPIKGSNLESRVLPKNCSNVPVPPKDSAANRNNAGLTADALLYLGPRDRLNASPSMPDLYLDLDFRAEMDRRNQLIAGAPLEHFTAKDNSAAARPYRINP
jgi:hypothetical protein